MLQIPFWQWPWADLSETPPTPFYLYHQPTLETVLKAWRSSAQTHQLDRDLQLHFALKSNRHPLVLQHLAHAGHGLDVVSLGELHFGLKSGFPANKIVFSGVGKTREELRAAVRNEIKLLIVESEGELQRLAEIASQEKKSVHVGLRLNPDVDAKTHPHIATGLWEHKFGMDESKLPSLISMLKAEPLLKLKGLSVHIGSQIGDLSALDKALDELLRWAQSFRDQGFADLNTLNGGGGLAVDYQHPFEMPDFTNYFKIFAKHHARWKTMAGSQAIWLSECGRSLVAQSGYLVTRVIGVKKNAKKNFLIVDGGMTELLRPALYGATHPVFHIHRKQNKISSEQVRLPHSSKSANQTWEIVGPICESADVLAHNIALDLEPSEGDLIVLGVAGAYGSVMSSSYNLRPAPLDSWVTNT